MNNLVVCGFENVLRDAGTRAMYITSTDVMTMPNTSPITTTYGYTGIQILPYAYISSGLKVFH